MSCTLDVWTPEEVEAWSEVPQAFITTALRDKRWLCAVCVGASSRRSAARPLRSVTDRFNSAAGPCARFASQRGSCYLMGRGFRCFTSLGGEE